MMLSGAATGRSRVEEIRRRLFELQLLMALRDAGDTCTELVAEHRDLVRERNRLVGKGAARA